MPQYERGHSGQEIGEMQQRLADLGFEIGVTNEFDEYTEEALRRYQQDWLYAEGTGVADEGTLNHLEYHHSTRPAGEIGGPQFGEEPIYGAGASSESHWWDGSQWIPFENPTPLMDEETPEPQFGLIDEETQAQLDNVNRDTGQVGGPQFGEEPIYGAGAGGSSQGYDEGHGNPFANPTPVIDSGVATDVGNAVTETYQEAGELFDSVVDQAGKILSGEEPMPDVRN
jgi:peptidoglycan hydrolase-like protein with peptidoglycan-binding domain